MLFLERFISLRTSFCNYDNRYKALPILSQEDFRLVRDKEGASKKRWVFFGAYRQGCLRACAWDTGMACEEESSWLRSRSMSDDVLREEMFLACGVCVCLIGTCLLKGICRSVALGKLKVCGCCVKYLLSAFLLICYRSAFLLICSNQLASWRAKCLSLRRWNSAQMAVFSWMICQILLEQAYPITSIYVLKARRLFLYCVSIYCNNCSFSDNCRYRPQFSYRSYYTYDFSLFMAYARS